VAKVPDVEGRPAGVRLDAARGHSTGRVEHQMQRLPLLAGARGFALELGGSRLVGVGRADDNLERRKWLSVSAISAAVCSATSRPWQKAGL
jgi:hypothetical protein